MYICWMPFCGLLTYSASIQRTKNSIFFAIVPCKLFLYHDLCQSTKPFLTAEKGKRETLNPGPPELLSGPAVSLGSNARCQAHFATLLSPVGLTAAIWLQQSSSTGPRNFLDHPRTSPRPLDIPSQTALH